MGFMDKVRDFLDDGKINGSVDKKKKLVEEAKAETAGTGSTGDPEIAAAKPITIRFSFTLSYRDPDSIYQVTMAGNAVAKLIEGGTVLGESRCLCELEDALELILENYSKGDHPASDIPSMKEDIQMEVRSYIQNTKKLGYLMPSFSTIKIS
ncbi:MAG: hypothetical protein IJ737_07550 [Ruminococcus sp.]|nr:hypothetical protein [Ruminococcus sp.]